MRVLLVEPNYFKLRARNDEDFDSQSSDSVSSVKSRRTRVSDETLRYPPIGLLKLARFHKDRGDQVRFVSGYDKRYSKKAPFLPSFGTAFILLHYLPTNLTKSCGQSNSI